MSFRRVGRPVCTLLLLCASPARPFTVLNIVMNRTRFRSTLDICTHNKLLPQRTRERNLFVLIRPDFTIGVTALFVRMRTV